MSTINVNSIAPESGTTITIGGSGDTVTLGSGASSSGFGVAVAGIAGVSVFTSSGTWTKATREAALGVTIKRVIVEVQGGGGSGAKLNGGYVSAGAAGGYAKKIIDVSAISSATITVGAGGAAVSSNANGNAGGSSIWSDGTNSITCGGGSGGDGSTSYICKVGGTATGGDINIPGGDSNYGRNEGRSSMFGFGGPDSQESANFTGGSSPDARGYGAGGAPTYTGTSGAGGDGIVIVTEIAG